MAHQTELEQFITDCRSSPITVEELKAKQIKYDFEKNSILDWLCANCNLTPEVLQWLLSNYPNSISDNHLKKNLRNLGRNRNIFPMEEYIILIDYLIKIKGNLYWKIPGYGTNILHELFAVRSFNAPMLNYLYQMDPQLDIWCEDNYEVSPLFYTIYNSYRLLELLHVIKSYEPTQSRTKIRIKYTDGNINYSFEKTINQYAQDSDQSTICALVGLCGELFSLIDPIYLTQEICSQFYSSKYFCWSTDQNSLIKLIPEQFPRKPCRLWRNQFAECEFQWAKNQTRIASPIRT
jgi:hypothetical protein